MTYTPSPTPAPEPSPAPTPTPTPSSSPAPEVAPTGATVDFPDPSQSPWTDPETGYEYIWDAQSSSWFPKDEVVSGGSETLDSVAQNDPKTKVNVTLGSLIYMDDGKDAYNGGPHELEAREGEATDWDTWFSQNSLAHYWRNIGYGDRQFVAVYDGGLATSLDGENWTQQSVSTYGKFEAVAYGNGRFVVVGSDAYSMSAKILSSPDAINWTVELENEFGWYGYDVTYGNGTFVAVGNGVATSIDGINWDESSGPGGGPWQSVTYGNGRFVAVSNQQGGRAAISFDGINWTVQTAPPGKWRSVAYGDGKFVAVAPEDTNRVMVSSDGVTWTAHLAAEQNGWFGVTYGAGRFVAVAYDGNNPIMTSPDGQTWFAHSSPVATYLWNVTYGDGKFIAVANDGGIINAMIILETSDATSGLYFDDELIATESNLEPLINVIEHHEEQINTIGGGLMPLDLSTLPDAP